MRVAISPTVFFIPVALLLSASTCGPTQSPPDDGCDLECPYGRKTDTAGFEFCECRATEVCVRVAAGPRMDPATGECHGFSTICDYPDGAEPCPACSASECGPAPMLPTRVCPDHLNVSGPGECTRNADATCGYTILQCPEYAFCGGIAGFACAPGQTCSDDPNDGCDPASGGADCGGICLPQACGSRNLPQCPDDQFCVRKVDATCGPEADCGGVCTTDASLIGR